MPINRNELTKEMVIKALQCKDADELIVLAKTGIAMAFMRNDCMYAFDDWK